INGYELTLSGANSPVEGDEVLIIYEISLNGGATPIVDYDKGEYYIDYEYIAEEILITYEYGDNCIDHSISSTLNIGDEYYVTYKVGALRDALLKNFGSLVNVPIL